VHAARLILPPRGARALAPVHLPDGRLLRLWRLLLRGSRGSKAWPGVSTQSLMQAASETAMQAGRSASSLNSCTGGRSGAPFAPNTCSCLRPHWRPAACRPQHQQSMRQKHSRAVPQRRTRTCSSARHKAMPPCTPASASAAAALYRRLHLCFGVAPGRQRLRTHGRQLGDDSRATNCTLPWQCSRSRAATWRWQVWAGALMLLQPLSLAH